MVSTRNKRKAAEDEEEGDVELITPTFVNSAPKAVSEEMKKFKKLMLILQVGTTHWVNTSVGKRIHLGLSYFLGLADIIDIRADPNDPRINEYYVHYREFDKRLDGWIPLNKFVLSKQAKPQQIPLADAERTLTRNLRKKMLSSLAPSPSPSPISMPPGIDAEYEKLEKEHEEATKVKNIQKIEIGQWEIDCWYFSPYPDEYCHADKLYICERCLKYMKQSETLARHEPICSYNGPTGNLIYLKENVAVYELDGEGPAKLYCQNFSLMAKLFLDHKTLYFDVSPFMFYVVCDISSGGPGEEERVHPVGYFSKEKESADGYNLACIMILPPYQRHGYGRFLIELSFEISKREHRLGSPEKPLSDLGLISYRSFWSQTLLETIRAFFQKKKVFPLISELVKATSITRLDVVDTLGTLGLTRLWKGDFVLNVESIKEIEKLLEKYKGRQQIRVDPEFLAWPTAYANVGCPGRKII